MAMHTNTVLHIYQLGFEVPEILGDNPDLPPSNHHSFELFKGGLRRLRFSYGLKSLESGV